MRGALQIPWAPRLLLAGRTFRLPVRAAPAPIELEASPFAERERRYAARDGAWYIYLRAPATSGDYRLVARQGGQRAEVVVQVRSLAQLRQPFEYGGASWPRRWPLGRPWQSTKRRQTLLDLPLPAVEAASVRFWLSLDDMTLWRQLPPAEMPRAHFVNVHQGCPRCGTAIFAYGGFYPWRRAHQPADFRSTCPHCQAVFPSNDLQKGDFSSGACPDDGYGYFDGDGHLYLFAATYARDQVRAFGAGIGQLAAQMRAAPEAATARALALMLLRYAVEIAYVAAAPQFRYGPSEGAEKPWNWGQTDWACGELGAKGMLRYCIDVPYISETLAIAYDAVWPHLRSDGELVERAAALGLEAQSPAELVALVEEMLACQLQCCLDGGARSNLPRVSQAVLALLCALDRADGQQPLEWLYERGPDRLRTFGVNNFFPDGTPPEATGGYDAIHADGLFALEAHLRRLRALHPRSYPEGRFPSLVADPRAARVARAPVEIGLIGRSWFQFGDGSAPGSAAQPGRAGGGKGRLRQPVLHAPLAPETLARASAWTEDATLRAYGRAIAAGRHPPLARESILDGIGIAIVRTGEQPARAAAGICYGDASGHRHADLLDVQLFAHGYAFLSDLGYPQSWASIEHWEGHWATHNSGWGLVEGLDAGRIAGRGRLVRLLRAPGVQVLEVEAERWAWDAARERWYRPGVQLRRLLALLETDGEGVALLDLMRIRGGSEHWRICRGAGADFDADLVRRSRPGTLAGEHVARGELGALPHPDYAALAYMDEVELFEAPPAWRGSWVCDAAGDAHLDVRQLAASRSALVRSARATAIMGRAEESNYAFRALAWRARPRPGESTCIDLLFEPRLGASRLESARAIPAPGAATGAEIRTRAGRCLRLYWAPGAGGETCFADGARLRGALAVAADGWVATCGAAALVLDGRGYGPAAAARRGTIAAVAAGCDLVEVEGLAPVRAGDRLVTCGRGRNYGIETAAAVGGGRQSLRLDATLLLGRGRVRQVRGRRVDLDFHILARTGYLHGARLRRADGTWAAIEAAHNPDLESTCLVLSAALPGLERGEWLEVLDAAPGDEVVVERCCLERAD